MKTRTFVSPVRFDDRTLAVRLRPPSLGEHNEQVLGPLRDGAKETV